MSRQNNLLKIFSSCCLLFATPKFVAQSIDDLTIGGACTIIRDMTVFEASVEVNGFFSAGTEFVLQISNKDGRFSSGGIIDVATETLSSDLSAGNSSVIDYSFMYPLLDGTGTPFASDNYRARVIAKGTLVKSFSIEIPIYIFPITDSLRLLPENGSCDGVNAILTADTGDTGDLDEYQWFRIAPDGSQVLVGITRENTFRPGQTGRYFYRPNLGNCEALLRKLTTSNIVTVDNDDGNRINFQISSNSTTNVICAEETIELSTNAADDSSYTYQWYRDNEQIVGANGRNLTVTGLQAEGTYRLDISTSTFSFASTCQTSSSNPIFIDLLNPTIKLKKPFDVILVPGSTATLEAEITGENTSIQWFRDGVAITDSTTTNLNVNIPGSYTAQVTGTSLCNVNTVMSAETIVVSAFDVESISIFYEGNAYVPCTQSEVVLRISSLVARNQAGGVSTITDSEVLDGFPISWKNNGVAIENESVSLLTINSPSGNGNYIAEVGGISSNSLNVIASLDNVVIVSDKPDNEIKIGEPITLSINSLAELQNVSYQWQRNGVDIAGANSTTLEVINQGVYRIKIDSDECSETISSEIIITSESGEIPNVVTPLFATNSRWSLPIEFTNNPDVKVTIIDPNGNEVYSRSSYNNEWPQTSDQLEETIYYYIISRGSEELKKGTITILR